MTRRGIRARLARPNRHAVIILGKEKSGTTAIAALLAEHAGASVTLDIPALFGPHLAPLLSGERSFDEVVRRNRLEFSRDVIKQPSLTYLFPQVRDAFPEARYLMIVRDPRDNIRSVLNRVGLRGDLEDVDPRDVESVRPGWRWHFERPGILGIPGDNYIEHAAERWNLAAETYLAHRNEMLLLRYEDFAKDKAGSIAGCGQALGLNGSRDISQSVDRQYQPRGRRNLTWLEFFGERNLKIIERTCEEGMKSLGYSIESSPGLATPVAAA